MSEIDFRRRRLLTAMALSPLAWHLPGASAASRPDLQRIIALEWLPTELLLALGITPFAIADIAGYRAWVESPTLPEGVVDIGLRTEPNLELMTQLRPSLIVYSAGYGHAPDKIARIAPGMGITFTDGKHPLDNARRSVLALGERLGLQAQARRHLNEFEALITHMRQRFAPWRGKPLLLMTLIDTRHALIIGQNSLFQQTMSELELQNAWRGDANFWGSAVVGLERLAAVDAARVICFAHNDETLMRQVAATPLWQAMPFVREGRFHRTSAVWFYGATPSAMRFCHLLDAALGAHP